jgi:hypothetical protein
MEIYCFTGLSDPEYQKITSSLRRITNSIPTRLITGIKLSLNTEQTRILLELLRFEQLDARYLTIKNAYAKTYRWLLEHP